MHARRKLHNIMWVFGLSEEGRCNDSISLIFEYQYISLNYHFSHFFFQKFVNMRELNLDNCSCLRHILDVSGLSNLEKFSFKNCRNLTKVHKSIGFLNKLEILNTEGCCKLKSFPPLELPSLRKLELSFCTHLKNFPEILGQMKNINILFSLN